MHTGGGQTGSRRRRGLVLLLIGYIAVTVSLGLAYQGPDNEFTGPPTCDGQAMSPGDRCITFRFGTRTGASSTSQTYEEALASQRDGVKETPWMWGVLLGTTGTVLVFTSAGRRMAARERPGRQVLTTVVATATVPLLLVSGVVGWLELRYDRDLRERSLFLTLPGDVPGGTVLMVALVAVATGLTYAAVRSSYRTARRIAQWRAEDEARLRQGVRYAPPPGSVFQEFFGEPSRTSPGQPASAATAAGAAAGPGAEPGTPATPQSPAPPGSGPYDIPIGLLRVGQFLGSVAAAVWIGNSSQWHWGCVLLVLAGGVAVTLMAPDHTPGVRLAFQFVLLALQAGAIVAANWIGGLTGWHAGIMAGLWVAVAAIAYAAATVTEKRSGPVDERPERRLHLPLASLVPLTLGLIAAVATLPLGALSGWRWDNLLVLWFGIGVVAVAHSVVTEKVVYPARRLAERVDVSGVVPIGLTFAAAAATVWLMDHSGGHPGVLLPMLWGWVCLLVVAQAVVAARRSRSLRPAERAA